MVGKSIERKQTFVLVAGSWLGGWFWKDVANLLREQGHDVYTPTLTGLADKSHLLDAKIDLTTHITDICNLIKWEQLQDIVLCGHSYAGMVISGVAERVDEGIIRSLVYLDALYLQSNECLVDYFPTDEEGVSVAELSGELFGLKGHCATRFDKLTTRHPLASWKERPVISGKRDEIKNKWFIVADNSGMPVFEQISHQLKFKPDWVIEHLPCAHMVAIEMPRETASILLRASIKKNIKR